jgi:hypothetical protein
MPMYQLRINIDPQYVVQIIQAEQQIVISKQVTHAGPSLAWLSINPNQSHAVEWQDQYSVYASQTSIQSGATISQLANQSAVPRSAHAFSDNVFSATAPQSTLGSGTYEVANQSGKTLTFGLAQGASLNGAILGPNAVFAATVLPGQWLDVTPSENISVFLSANTTNAMCLGSVMGPTLLVPFVGNTTLQTISFDYNLGGFQLS